MTPTWKSEDSRIVLYHCDCMGFMATCQAEQFDLAIVDPPYGINVTRMDMGAGFSNGKTKRVNRFKGAGKLKNMLFANADTSWDLNPPKEDYFRELFRISKNQIIWGGNYFKLPPTRCVVCWDKKQPWENFSQWEMAWTSFDKPAALFARANSGCINEKKIHPTQKPVQLYSWLLKKFAREGYSIIDTHMGSGSSVMACQRAGFQITACEKNADYFNGAKERICKALQQGVLI